MNDARFSLRNWRRSSLISNGVTARINTSPLKRAIVPDRLAASVWATLVLPIPGGPVIRIVLVTIDATFHAYTRTSY